MTLVALGLKLWSYGIKLWVCASESNALIMQKSNTVIMQKSQSKILGAIANAPRYITNHTLFTDINIPYVSDVIHKRINKYHNNLEAHLNPLLEPILQTCKQYETKTMLAFRLARHLR